MGNFRTFLYKKKLFNLFRVSQGRARGALKTFCVSHSHSCAERRAM